MRWPGRSAPCAYAGVRTGQRVSPIESRSSDAIAALSALFRPRTTGGRGGVRGGLGARRTESCVVSARCLAGFCANNAAGRSKTIRSRAPLRATAVRTDVRCRVTAVGRMGWHGQATSLSVWAAMLQRTPNADGCYVSPAAAGPRSGGPASIIPTAETAPVRGLRRACRSSPPLPACNPHVLP